MNAYILAGGKGSRLHSRKGFLTIDGVPIVSRVCEAARPLVQEIVLVGDQRQLASLSLRVITEPLPGAGPLAALCAALDDAHPNDALLLPWDAPFITTEVLCYLRDVKGEADAAIPCREGLIEPLLAIYGPRCRSVAHSALNSGKRRVISFYDDINVRWVSGDELRPFGEWERLFLNVNTLADLNRARELAVQLQESSE
ncbi:MAG: molybdenum cofactor guanylyltransferase [Candidatus Zipacnadales bacterium]